MPNLGNISKSLKSIFGLNSGLKIRFYKIKKREK